MDEVQNGKRYRAIMGIVVWACLAGACGSSSGTSSTASPDVWATVDGRQIRRDEVEKVYRSSQQAAQAVSDDEALGMKLTVLDDYINQDLLIARARVLGVEATDADVETTFGEQKRGMTEEAFVETLKSRGLTVDDFKRGLKRDLTAQRALDKEVTSKIAITDDEITAFYNANKASFNVREPQYRIAQIVITPTRDPELRNRMNSDASTPAEAKAKFQMLMDKLRGGTDFGTLAVDYSEDSNSIATSGDIGYVAQSELNRLPPQLKDIVLKTEPGRVSTVTIGQGFTIMTVLAREAAGQKEITTPAVRDGIRDILRNRKEQLLRSAYVTNTRADAKITNHLAKLIVDSQGKVPSAVAK